MILSEKIQSQRKRLGLSQEQFAEQLGVSRQAVSKWESGKTAPDIERIAKMSELFGVSADFLLKSDPADDTVSLVQTTEQSVKPKRRVPKRILFVIVGVLLVFIAVGTVLSLLNNHIIFFSSNAKMEYYFDSYLTDCNQANVATLFNEKFAGTEQEETAISYLESSLNRNSLLSIAAWSDEWESLLTSMDTKNEKITSLLDGMDVLKLTTPITSLHADPDEFLEKEVLILGGIQSNDLSRKMVRLVSGDYSIECSYAGEDLFETGIDWDSYHTTATYYGQESAAAFGYIKQYSDSNDVYLVIYKYCDPGSMGQTTCDAIRSIADWDVSAANEQEARPMLRNTVPSYYPSDVLPLFRLYNVLNCKESDDSVVLSYQSNGDYEEAIAYYHDLLIDIDGKYIQQNLSSQMQGMTVLLPGTNNCAYILVSNGSVIEGNKTEKTTIAIVIGSNTTYYETEGTVVSS